MTAEMNKTSEEIKELVKKLRAQGKKNYGLYAEVADALEALVAERDRLKAALVRLRDCDWVIRLPDRMDGVRRIAREALEGEE